MKCENCRFWEPQDSTCHREPATCRPPCNPAHPYQFQRVPGRGWCGEWQPKQQQAS